MRFLSLLLFTAVCLFSCSSPTAEQPGAQADPVQEAPATPAAPELKGLRAVYENARMVLSSPTAELYRLMVPSRTEIPAHESGTRIVYCLDDVELSIQTEGGEISADWSAGEVHVLPKGVLSMKNLTEGAPVQFLMLMRTDEKLPDCVPAPKGGPMSQPTNGKILYDGEGIFAIEYTLGAGNLAASLPNAPFLLYGLSDGTLSVSQGPSGGKARRTMNGFADWMDGCATRLNNAGDKPVRFAVMGFWAE